MAIRPILRMGDPRLLQVSAPVREFGAPALHELIADMHETMLAANGAGLAAPQIGAMVRVVIFGGGQTPRYPDADAVPYTVLINPKLRMLRGGKDEDWEGCLSVPVCGVWSPVTGGCGIAGQISGRGNRPHRGRFPRPCSAARSGPPRWRALSDTH